MGCIPNPRFDWTNARYKGYVIDESGKPIEKALVIIKNKNILTSVVQTTETDKNGYYEIEPKKIFFIFVTIMAEPPECIDIQYVVHPDYNVYIKKMFNGQTGRICTNIEVNRKNITLIKQDTSRTLTSKNKLTWDNIKVGTILYDKDDSCQAQILD